MKPTAAILGTAQRPAAGRAAGKVAQIRKWMSSLPPPGKEAPPEPNPSDLSDPASSSALEEYADLPASAITPPDSPRAALEHQQRPVSDQVADIAEEARAARPDPRASRASPSSRRPLPQAPRIPPPPDVVYREGVPGPAAPEHHARHAAERAARRSREPPPADTGRAHPLEVTQDPFQDTVGSGGVLMGSVRSALKDVIVRGWRDVARSDESGAGASDCVERGGVSSPSRAASSSPSPPWVGGTSEPPPEPAPRYVPHARYGHGTPSLSDTDSSAVRAPASTEGSARDGDSLPRPSRAAAPSSTNALATVGTGGGAAASPTPPASTHDRPHTARRRPARAAPPPGTPPRPAQPWEPAPPAPAPNEAEAAISPASSMQMNGAELPQDVNEAVWALLEGAHVGGIPPRPRGGGSRGVPPPAMMQAALALAIGELRDARAGAREQAEGDGGWGSEGAERRGTRVFREVDEKDAEAVREELAGLRAQLRARDTEREAAEAALREALAGMQGRAEAAEGTVGSLRAQLRALQEQLTWNNEKVEDERAAMAVEMDEAVLEERKKVEKAQGEIAELQRALEGAWREARLARERAQAADARREEAEAVHTILAGKVAEAERKAAAASDEVERTHRAAQGALRRAKDLEEVLAREKDARALAERSERRALRRIAEQVALESERGLALTQAQGLRSRAAEVDAVRVVTELSPAPAEGPRAGEGDVGELEVPEGSSMGELRAAMHYVGDKVLDAKRAEAEAARREARQAEEAFEVWRERETASALAHAPRHLRPLGVAARFLVCAGPGSAAARVAKRLAADLGRTHATRLELASDDSGSSSGPLPPAPAVPLAHRMVVVVGRQSGTDADANSPAWRTLAARLMEALRCNAQVLLVTEAPAEAHRGGCTADVAAAAKVLESKYVRAAQALLAAESNTRVEAGVALGAGAPGAGRLWDKAVSAIRAHGGVPDAALMELPAEELRRLRPRGEAERALGARVEGSPAKGALVPVSAIDFVGLTGIRHLDISLSGPGGAAWISALPALLARGGAALTQLSLRDCPSDAAAADVADALVGAECPPKTAGFNVALPLRGLVEGTVRDVDATGGPGAQAEDVLLLCRVVEKCESLRSLAVAGRAQSATAGAPEPRWRRLAAAVLAHPQMRRVNGIRIERGEDGTAELTGVIQDKVGLFGPVLQLEGAEVGPLGCALVAKWLAGESGTVPGGVEVIDLNGCSVGCAGLAAFAKAFRDAGAEDHAGPGASVRILRIRRDSFVSPRGASALKALLSACPGLARLDLSACAIGDDGARAIAAALPVCGARLVDVSLGTNRVGAAGARALAAAIGEGHTPELRVLDLQGNVVGDSGAAELATALQRQAAAEGGGAVECLRLADNYSIGAEGARAMGELAAASAALETLDLSRNHLGPEGARALARGLRRSRGLATLDLRWCKLRAEGVTHICEALGGGAGQAPPIRALDLARNNIGDRGAAAVATMLRKGVPSLATLDLATNAIGLEGFRQLSLAVREGGTQLGSLCLEGNQMDTGGRQRLEEAVRKAAKARAAAAAQGVDRPMSAATSQRAAVAEA